MVLDDIFFPERLFLNVEHLTKGMLGTYTLDIHIYVVARTSNQPGYLFFENSLWTKDAAFMINIE